MKIAQLFAAAVALIASPAVAQTFDRQGWRDDLAAMRTAVDQKYANLDWLRDEREVDVDALFARADAALTRARSDADARALLDQVVRRFADGHVALRWSLPPAPAQPTVTPPERPTPATLCASLGYRTTVARLGTAAALSGYRALSALPIPTGLVPAGADTVGVIRIGEFDAVGASDLCVASVTALGIDPASCDSTCADRVLTETYRRLGGALVAAAHAVRAAGAGVLLVDITGNGGGSEWAEAAARTVTPVRLTSARLAFVRGPHWARLWSEQAQAFSDAARRERGASRAMLLARAAEADAARQAAERPCQPRTGCTRLATAGYATGLIGSAAPGSLPDREWAVRLFSPAQHTYWEGAWSGPLIVMTDNETWSAAEQFAAVLQDNRAAVIMGARTGGSGCGYSWGGTPTRLPHSGATLLLPDCARLRADGSNEVRGVIPDLPVSLRANDGAALRARLTAAQLPTAVSAARALHQARR